MLPVDARIRHSRDFGSVLKRGRRAARGGVVVHWAPREAARQTATDRPAQRARAGFVVSKAVGNAVVRNRVKRRLRHAVAEQMVHWPDEVDVVVRATPKAAERDFTALGRDLAAAVDAARTGKGGRRANNGGQRSRL